MLFQVVVNRVRALFIKQLFKLHFDLWFCRVACCWLEQCKSCSKRHQENEESRSVAGIVYGYDINDYLGHEQSYII